MLPFVYNDTIGWVFDAKILILCDPICVIKIYIIFRHVIMYTFVIH